MTFEFSSAEQEIALDGPMGPDAFFVHRLEGNDALSGPFHYRLELYSGRSDHDLDALLGQGMTLRLREPVTGETAFLHGIASRVRRRGQRGEVTRYELDLVPVLWRLRLRTDCRIFQARSVPDIVGEILRSHAVDHEVALADSYGERDYCVQYRETDFDFVSRLLEDEGIAYYFRHEEGRHVLVLTDDTTSAPPCPVRSEHELADGSDANRLRGHVRRFDIEQALVPGTWASNDYNFMTPYVDLTVRQAGQDAPEVFEFPGIYLDRSEGQHRARRRVEELEWQRELAEGDGQCPTLRAGHAFTLSGSAGADGTYLLIATQRVAVQGHELLTGSGEAHEEPLHEVRFRAIPSAVHFRPRRGTPKPRIHGAQPAVVVGKAGEEIWTDKYGRVKVQFFWDREGVGDERSSCWIRCAHAVAGKNWGQVAIPRVEQEVLVTFLEGDPDRPVIVGSLYNDVMMPPYGLPAEQSKSTTMTRSTKGGTPTTFNEIRFEDRKGAEEVYVQAEKDMVRLVKNDDTLTVAHDRTMTIENDRTLAVTNNDTVDVGVTHLLTAGTSIELRVGANSIVIDQSGVTITGTVVRVEGMTLAEVTAPLTTINV